MNILFICTSRESMPYPVFPLGASYVVQALLDKGHSVDILDMILEDDSADSLAKKLDELGGKIIQREVSPENLAQEYDWVVDCRGYVQNLDKDLVPSRIAARGGLGAVMGSKCIKAIVIDFSDGEKPPIADQPAFRAAQKTYTKSLMEKLKNTFTVIKKRTTTLKK